MTTPIPPSANDLHYPIGPAVRRGDLNPEERADAIRTLAELPEQLREALRGLDDDQLDTPYRPEGWTVRQLTHHIADSHTTAFHRMRRALTENDPTIEVYDEKAFAQLADSSAPAEWSVNIIEALHARWTMLFGALTDEQWKRTFNHPERGRMNLIGLLSLYAWHSQHHLAHIQALRLREGW